MFYKYISVPLRSSKQKSKVFSHCRFRPPPPRRLLFCHRPCERVFPRRKEKKGEKEKPHESAVRARMLDPPDRCQPSSSREASSLLSHPLLSTLPFLRSEACTGLTILPVHRRALHSSASPSWESSRGFLRLPTFSYRCERFSVIVEITTCASPLRLHTTLLSSYHAFYRCFSVFWPFDHWIDLIYSFFFYTKDTICNDNNREREYIIIFLEANRV